MPHIDHQNSQTLLVELLKSQGWCGVSEWQNKPSMLMSYHHSTVLGGERGTRHDGHTNPRKF